MPTGKCLSAALKFIGNIEILKNSHRGLDENIDSTPGVMP